MANQVYIMMMHVFDMKTEVGLYFAAHLGDSLPWFSKTAGVTGYRQSSRLAELCTKCRRCDKHVLLNKEFAQCHQMWQIVISSSGGCG
jgi:hypothetical protein